MKFKKFKLIIAIMLIIGIVLPIYSFAENTVNNTETQNIQEDVFKQISAPNLLLAETNSGRILYERNTNEKIYPASITKLMTAILVVENCKLDEIVTVSENAVRSVPSGYVNAKLQVDERLTVENLLNAMLIPSANDAANALAEYVGGSIESFSSMMNTKARELGCTGTNFSNPSGLHEENHYTTTRDLFFISGEAIKNNTIKTIIGKTTYTLPKSNKYSKEDRVLTTTNYMKRKELSKYYYQYCIGAKTGYTGEAKNCVVEFASKNNVELTAIVMGESSKVQGQKFLDAKKMFEYGFNNYENKQVYKKDDVFKTIKILNGTKDTRELELLCKDNINIVIGKNKNVATVDWNEEKYNNDEYIMRKAEYSKLKAPIQKGDVVGKIICKYNGIEYSTELIANGNVEESKVLQQSIQIIIIILIIFIIYILIKSKKKTKNNKKRYVEYR